MPSSVKSRALLLLGIFRWLLRLLRSLLASTAVCTGAGAGAGAGVYFCLSILVSFRPNFESQQTKQIHR